MQRYMYSLSDSDISSNKQTDMRDKRSYLSTYEQSLLCGVYTIHKNKVYLGSGNYWSSGSRIWEQVNKQAELLTKHLGIEIDIINVDHFKGYRLYLQLEDQDNKSLFSVNVINNNICSVKIRSFEAFKIKANEALSEYIDWCRMNHKDFDDELIIPNAIINNDLSKLVD